MLLKSRSSTVPGTDFRIVMLGDSITSSVVWYDLFAAAVEAAQIAAGAAPLSSGLVGVGPTACHTWINSGFAGDDCTCIILDTVAVRVTAYKPDAVIYFMDVNCQQHATGAPSRSGINTTNTVCTTNHLLILQQIQAQNPGVPILRISALCNGEQWPDGANAADAVLDQKVAITQAACATANVQFINLRPAFFAWEQVNNPAKDNVGHLTTDGIHPFPTLGRQFLRDNVLPSITYQR